MSDGERASAGSGRGPARAGRGRRRDPGTPGRWRRHALAVLVALCGLVSTARRPAAAEPAGSGDAVALLPLDAERSLEIYGQPVASEIARALGAGHVQVFVVGPRTAVPERARLIIDGTIAQGRASAVTISIRIRNTIDGVVLETLAASAPSLARIDGAAAELSARVLPIVRDRLAAQHRAAADLGHATGTPEIRPAAAPDRPVVVAFGDARSAADRGPLPGALEAAVASWLRAQHRGVQKIDLARFDRAAARAVAATGGDVGIGFWILGWTVEPATGPGAIAMARARVRVRIASPSGVVFDRVVATDTVLGDRGLSQPELAARVAREVLAILRPHLRRTVPSWQ